eukprot:6196357-Pleurochrysis_carterae.AAC.1
MQILLIGMVLTYDSTTRTLHRICEPNVCGTVQLIPCIGAMQPGQRLNAARLKAQDQQTSCAVSRCLQGTHEEYAVVTATSCARASTLDVFANTQHCHLQRNITIAQQRTSKHIQLLQVTESRK